MNLSRRKMLQGAAASAAGGAALMMTADVVLADQPLGLLPKLDSSGKLPGKQELYALRDGQGEYRLIGGQVATLIARPQETNSEFVAAIFAGGKGAEFPLHKHATTDETIYVMDGRLELYLGDKVYMMTAGDYAYIPAGTEHGYIMRSWRTRFLTWSLGDKLAPMYDALGSAFTRPVQPETADNAIAGQKLAKAAGVADITFTGAFPKNVTPELVTVSGIPESPEPYVVQAGEGERLIAADQLFSFVQTNANSGEKFFSVLTEGPAGAPIPWHYHQHHTENFFCLEGLMTMWVNGQEVKLYPGDYMQIPANTVHSYRLDAPYTAFFGWLVPGVFEPFFRYLGQPYQPHVFPVEPAPFNFGRVMAHIDELDLKVLAVKD